MLYLCSADPWLRCYVAPAEASILALKGLQLIKITYGGQVTALPTFRSRMRCLHQNYCSRPHPTDSILEAWMSCSSGVPHALFAPWSSTQ